MSYDVGILIRKVVEPQSKIELVEFSCSSGEELSKIGRYDSIEKAIEQLEELSDANPYEAIAVKGFRK